MKSELKSMCTTYISISLTYCHDHINRITDTQQNLLGNIEMKRLFHCLELFVGWLQGGLYDFRSLPISVFDPLKDGDVNTIMEGHTKYSGKLSNR